MLAYNAGVVTVSGLRIKKEGKGMDNTIRITGKMREAVKLPMCGKDSQGNLYEVDNLSLMKNGRRFLPVMGESTMRKGAVSGTLAAAVICGAFWRPAAKLACRCGCASGPGPMGNAATAGSRTG